MPICNVLCGTILHTIVFIHIIIITYYVNAETALYVRQHTIYILTEYNIFCAHFECTINFSLHYYSIAKDHPSSMSIASSVPTSSKPTLTRSTTISSTSKTMMHACMCAVCACVQALESHFAFFSGAARPTSVSASVTSGTTGISDFVTTTKFTVSPTMAPPPSKILL